MKAPVNALISVKRLAEWARFDSNRLHVDVNALQEEMAGESCAQTRRRMEKSCWSILILNESVSETFPNDVMVTVNSATELSIQLRVRQCRV